MDKCLLPYFLTLSMWALGIQISYTQGLTMTSADKQMAVNKIAELLHQHYVFPDVAKKTNAHLKSKLAEGYFDNFSDHKAFAEALTVEAQAVANDKHLRVRTVAPRDIQADGQEQIIENRLRALEQGRANTAGFATVQKLEGNIGYLDLRGFTAPQWGAPIADHYMGLITSSDAIIIDLRKNGGGSPDMVRYLCSYFFDEPVHLNSIYRRVGNKTEEFWSLENVGGKKLVDVPLFVLTSNYTFSGAEEFAYNMQTQKRAILIGETTGGGANPGGGFPVSDHLMIFIPTGQAINPVTKTNWEGRGVVPDVKVTATEALDKAIQMASEAAQIYRDKNKVIHRNLLTNLYNHLEKPKELGVRDSVATCLKACTEAGIMSENDINLMGYDYLMQQQKPEVAEIIFYANTVIFPVSANCFDSYGECLAANGKLDEALLMQRKAVALGESSNDPNMPIFNDNLKALEQRLMKKP